MTKKPQPIPPGMERPPGLPTSPTPPKVAFFSTPMIARTVRAYGDKSKRPAIKKCLRRLGLECDGRFIFVTDGGQWNGEFENGVWAEWVLDLIKLVEQQ